MVYIQPGGEHIHPGWECDQLCPPLFFLPLNGLKYGCGWSSQRKGGYGADDEATGKPWSLEGRKAIITVNCTTGSSCPNGNALEGLSSARTD